MEAVQLQWVLFTIDMLHTRTFLTDVTVSPVKLPFWIHCVGVRAATRTP